MSIVAFSFFGLVGPAIQRVSWPDASFLILIWPALLLTSGGSAATMRHDFMVAAGVNVFLFAVLGFFMGKAALRQWSLVVAYGVICGAVTLGEAWGAGFSLAFFAWRELAAALVLYLIPFTVLWFFNRWRLQER
jgi:hypothetical protein